MHPIHGSRRHGFLSSLSPLLEVLGSVLNPTPGGSCILIAVPQHSESSLSRTRTVFCGGVWGQGSRRSYCPYCVAALPLYWWHHCRELWDARVQTFPNSEPPRVAPFQQLLAGVSCLREIDPPLSLKSLHRFGVSLLCDHSSFWWVQQSHEFEVSLFLFHCKSGRSF